MSVVMHEDANITQISIYHKSGSGDMLMAVYDDDGYCFRRKYRLFFRLGISGFIRRRQMSLRQMLAKPIHLCANMGRQSCQ